MKLYQTTPPLERHRPMKHLLLTTIAAVLLVGCGPKVDIHKAAYVGNIEAVKQHIAAGGDVDAKDDLFGRAPLHWAAVGGSKEIAELLIAAGADVNGKVDDGWRWTPLHNAAQGGHKEIAELLISKGADVNARKNNGITPLDLAVDKETTDLLRKHGAK